MNSHSCLYKIFFVYRYNIQRANFHSHTYYLMALVELNLKNHTKKNIKQNIQNNSIILQNR